LFFQLDVKVLDFQHVLSSLLDFVRWALGPHRQLHDPQQPLGRDGLRGDVEPRHAAGHFGGALRPI
ncbi:MAG: hypothetical protein QNJ09_05550, partial [Paracoccaceae bacterium]|nr:hypothetical protein [Paracoccaceae bacterium]